MKKYIVYFLLPLFVWGCFKDEGNYDYVDGIEIDVQGIEKKYEKKVFQEKLEITPTVRAVRPEDRCEYLWLIYPEGGSSIEAIDTIAREKDLDWLVNVKPGSYTVEFIATDCDRLNFFKRCTTKLVASTDYTEGFYVLKETSEGNTELDLHSFNRGIEQHDLLARVHGAAFSGRPDNLGLFFNFSFIDEETGEPENERTLNIITEDNAYILRTTDLTTIRDHSSMFYEVLKDDKPYALRNSAMQYKLGNIYLSSRGASYSTGDRFGLPAAVADYPEMGGSPFGFFDSYAAMLNLGIFYYFDSNTGTFCSLSPLFGKFEMSVFPEGCGIRHRLIHYAPAGLDFNTFTVKHYALFQDKDNASKHYLYKFLYSPMAGNKVEIAEIPSASLLNRADKIVLSKEQDFYYFISDNRLYRYVVGYHQDEELNLTGISATERIVLLKERYYYETAPMMGGSAVFNYLVVGTYDGEDYRLYFYNMVGGAPAGMAEKVITGKGKPVDIQYMTPDFINFNGFYSNYMATQYNEY